MKSKTCTADVEDNETLRCAYNQRPLAGRSKRWHYTCLDFMFESNHR